MKTIPITPDPLVLDSLRGRTVLITGGASGIGRDLAIACTRAGADVVVGDLNVDGLMGTKELCGSSDGGRCIPFPHPCDVTSPTRQAELFAFAEKELGGKVPDVVVANAGVNELGDYLAVKEKGEHRGQMGRDARRKNEGLIGCNRFASSWMASRRSRRSTHGHAKHVCQSGIRRVDCLRWASLGLIMKPLNTSRRIKAIPGTCNSIMSRHADSAFVFVLPILHRRQSITSVHTPLNRACPPSTSTFTAYARRPRSPKPRGLLSHSIRARARAAAASWS